VSDDAHYHSHNDVNQYQSSAEVNATAIYPCSMRWDEWPKIWLSVTKLH